MPKLTLKQYYELFGNVLALAEAGVYLTPSLKDDAVIAQVRKFYEQIGVLLATDRKLLKAAAPCDDEFVNEQLANLLGLCPCDDDCCPDDGG